MKKFNSENQNLIPTKSGTVLCQSGLPTFKWDETSVSTVGEVPLLIVGFPDGGDDDSAILKSVNPIPIGSHEAAIDVDPCIYIGYLLNDPEVTVTLTGGCSLEDSFEVKQKLKILGTFIS